MPVAVSVSCLFTVHQSNVIPCIHNIKKVPDQCPYKSHAENVYYCAYYPQQLVTWPQSNPLYTSLSAYFQMIFPTSVFILFVRCITKREWIFMVK